MPDFGLIAIGRNEGERLRACLASIPAGVPVVYVDSASTDDSVAAARAAGADVVRLDMGKPFSAARARNEGFERLLQRQPDVTFVQFIDGDCALVPGWLDAARAAFLADDKLAVACGRRREKYPDASIYNQLCDLEWDTPVGPAKSCGGDAMIRVSAFQQIGGYDPTVIAGEEPEMCVRLRQAGWIIRRLPNEMTLHDAAMTRFSQWWKRNVRAGHAYAQGYAMHGGTPEFFRRKEVRSNFVLGILFPIFAGLILTFVVGDANFESEVAQPATAKLAFLIELIAFAALFVIAAVYLRTLISVRRGQQVRGRSARLATWYAFAVTIGKLPQAIGQAKFWLNQARGRQAGIIEYKSAAAVTPMVETQ